MNYLVAGLIAAHTLPFLGFYLLVGVLGWRTPAAIGILAAMHPTRPSGQSPGTPEGLPAAGLRCAHLDELNAIATTQTGERDGTPQQEVPVEGGEGICT